MAAIVESPSQLVLQGEPLDFRGESQLTVEAWIKTTTDNGSFVEQYRGLSTFGLRVFTGKLRFFYLKDATAPGSDKWQFALGSTTINDGQWHHVAGVLTGSEMRIYVDGVLELSTTQEGSIPTAPLTNVTTVRMGFSVNVVGTPLYDGLIDEPAIYGRPLSTLEIGRLYAADVSGKCVP